jgi:hypothetical protein
MRTILSHYAVLVLGFTFGFITAALFRAGDERAVLAGRAVLEDAVAATIKSVETLRESHAGVDDERRAS